MHTSTVSSWFNPDSGRAKTGLEFQDTVLRELREVGVDALTTGDWLRSMDPCLEDRQVWALEKTWGDIVCKRRDGALLFLECVTASQEDTVFPTSKFQFDGKNKWYLFGWDDQRHFVPSGPWNAYAKKVDRVIAREHDTVVCVNRRQYASMRCGTSGLKRFCEENEVI